MANLLQDKPTSPGENRVLIGSPPRQCVRVEVKVIFIIPDGQFAAQTAVNKYSHHQQSNTPANDAYNRHKNMDDMLLFKRLVTAATDEFFNLLVSEPCVSGAGRRLSLLTETCTGLILSH